MNIVRRFWGDRSGGLREATTIVAVGVTLVGVGSALGLDRLTRDGSLPRIAIIMPNHEFADRLPSTPADRGRVDPGALDHDPVASIPDRLRPIRLDPCTGAPR